MKEKLPSFKYHPNAYSVGIFEQVPKRNCSICDRETTYIYSGPFYSTDDVNNVCPWCIHDGRAAKEYNAILQGVVEYENKLLSVCFNDEINNYMYFIDDEEVDIMDDENLNEILFQTPGYIAWQEAQWLSHCNEFCAFIRYLDKSELDSMKDDLEEEIRFLDEYYGLTLEQIGDDMGLYLFQCLKCGKYRLYSDHT